LLTNIPGIKRGKDGANGKEVVELVERHLGGVALPSSVVCSAESKAGGGEEDRRLGWWAC
jgi:hypothetical protein